MARTDRLAAVLGIDPVDAPMRDGYIDLAGDASPPSGVAQRLMRTSVVPLVYERWWRPALGRVAKSTSGPSMAGELALARELLALAAGETVLDVACGPGNFTRAFAADVGPEGTVVGIDLSATMLRQAVRETVVPQVTYVRADITALPLQPASADAVCCFAALHLFADPGAALDVMADALDECGRMALLTSARPEATSAAAATEVLARLSGMRMFTMASLADGLARRGLEVTYQRRFGAVQVLGARRAAGH